MEAKTLGDEFKEILEDVARRKNYVLQNVPAYILTQAVSEFVSKRGRERETWDEYFMSIARKIATRSKDSAVGTGAIIIGPDKEPRTAGYNGFPRGVDDDPPSAMNARPSIS